MRARRLARPRHTLLALVALASIALAGSAALAQPAPQPAPAAPHAGTAAPKGPNAGAPGRRLHPPREKMRPGRGLPPSSHGAQPGPVSPVHGSPDAHGDTGGGHGSGHGAACPGHGPNDRPPGINLTHGWLGANNEKAVPPPAEAKVGSVDWWVWRLTPYPWRYHNEEDKCDLRNQPVPLLAPIINFAVLAYLLVRFGRKPIKEGLRKRAAAITAEIDAAAEIKRKARERLRGYQDELDHLDETLGALREKYAAEAEAEKKDIVEEAGHTRDRMLADAQFRVAQEAKGARDALSRKALEEALVAAEQLLQDRITPQDVDRLADEYLEFVGPALREQVGTRQGAAS